MEREEKRIALLELYRDEWKYRDSAFSSLLWRFVSLSLIIIFFPHLIARFGVSPDAGILKIPIWIYSITGIFCALFGAYVTYCDAKKIEKLDLAYQNILKETAKEYMPESLKKYEITRGKRIFSYRTNNVLFVTYGFVILLGILNIALNLSM